MTPEDAQLYADIHFAYTGTPARRIFDFQPYTLSRALSHSANFKGSPIWRHFAPRVIRMCVAVTGFEPPDEFVRRAIVEHWSDDTLFFYARREVKTK